MTRVGIVAFDDAEVLDVCGPFEVFSVANRLSPGSFDVLTISADPSGDSGRPVLLRHGLPILTLHTLWNAPDVDLLVVPGGVTARAETDASFIEWLAERADTPRIASVCTGAFLLATAGILTDQTVTTHHEDIAELARRWPELTVVGDRRWVDQGRLHTSGGISAGIDLSLHLVELLASSELAERTARQMEFAWTREP